MLKQIAVSELELGMFVHKFEGSWFEHPFWKARFLLDDAERLATIKASRISAVVIDTERGRDIVPHAASAAAYEVPGAKPAAYDGPERRMRNLRRRVAAQVAADRRVSMEDELAAAATIAETARDKLNKAFIAARLGRALDVRKVEPVVSDILASVRRNPQAFSGLMRCKLKNEQVFRHALSVSALMVALADRMKLPAADIHNCGLAGLLLDIGVNYLPHAVEPPGGDYRNLGEPVWQQHVVLGHRALVNDGGLPQLVLDACLYHHERIDGRGYPQQLAGDKIPLIARMAAICDSFDFHLTGTDRSHALDPAVAIAAMRDEPGAYDPEILRLFIETVGLYPVGSFVVLASQKVAMVIDEDRKDPLRPVVQAFYSLGSGERILPHRITLAQGNDNERIMGIADLTGLGLPEDAQLRELVFLSTYRNAAQG